MPPPKNLAARSSGRRNTQKDEEPPMQTRSGRGSKSATSPRKPDIVSPRATKQSLNDPPSARTQRKTASAGINYSKLNTAADIYGLYDKPIFTVCGIPPEFFDKLKPKTPKKMNGVARILDIFTEPIPPEELNNVGLGYFDSSEEEEEESDEPVSARPVATRGRGRGGRGSRGGRGRGRGSRGGRGGRGGRGRGSTARTTSPIRTRPPRNAAPVFPLTEEDDEDPSNQNSPMVDAKTSPESEGEDDQNAVAHQHSEDEEEEEGSEEDDSTDYAGEPKPCGTPPGSPPPTLVQAYHDPDKHIPVPVAIPKISLPDKSTSKSPRENMSPPAEAAVPKLLDPEDDQLTDSDLPEPYLYDRRHVREEDCEDRADYLLKTQFDPMTDVQDIIASLTKHPFAQRSTDSLYALAENTQMILKAWQDQYLELDARTAPHAHPPKKPCNGGRIPINTQQFEDMKEADLYGYVYDPKKAPGTQDPFTQRPGHEKSGRRELRQRRTRDMLDSAAPSEEEEEEGEGSRPAKRQRRATRPFESSDQGTGTAAEKPKKNNGWGGARKKGVSKYSKTTNTASATPEPEVHGRGKRGKAASLALHPRIQEMRGESVAASSGDDGASDATGDAEDHTPYPKRGRPAGSKNVGRRSDYGQKKGPRKRVHEEEVEISANVANSQPPMLQSMSEGQGQFTIDAPAGPKTGQPRVPTETVFQATPQPPGMADSGSLERSAKAQTPDAYMNTTPLSQYGTPYMDDSGANSASGSRKKPRVKSEKRSQSMTIWWAERKARQKELGEQNGTPAKSTLSRSSSSTGRRGGRGGSKASEAQHRPTYSNQEALPPHSGPPPISQAGPPEMYAQMHPDPPQPHAHPFSAPSPSDPYMAYPPPPPGMMMQTPLAAVPSGTSIQSRHSPPGLPGGPSHAQGRALAPAPTSHLPQSYPSPFGPRTARPKSNGPMPLAPAPIQQHVSPYGPPPPSQQQGGQQQGQQGQIFKVMVPGPPPPGQQQEDDRRESR